jgi:4-hydroxy-3-polyprenylbenzoate decarboxylase
MAYSGLSDFIDHLEKSGELLRTKTFVDPVLEIAEVTDRISKTGGKALLFENTGTAFPVLINGFGSEKRMSMAIGRNDLNDAGKEISDLFASLSGTSGGFYEKLAALPYLNKITGFLPSRSKRKGKCQQIIISNPDLGILPVLKCWPYDGNRYFTLPLVHTVHPETKKTNLGMYRMQLLDKNTTGMHWQMHKTGANHFEAWKKTGKIMPVSVALGGDPVYTYASTAPLPENIDEYILAGFLRKKKVKLVKCITNDLYVPDDADIIIEGFVDPSDDLIWEGPFGDHTGFYSLADWYPKFHVTCITRSANAVYPATIVGVPPQEDAYFARATEKIFLAPIKLTLQPEVADIHMPDAGVAHNLVIVKIVKSYPGQGMKVLNSLFGAGQMMFTKYMIVLDEDIDIRDYKAVLKSVLTNTDFKEHVVFSRGPLDVLDHSSDTFAFGGKMGIDSTKKTNAESQIHYDQEPVQKKLSGDFFSRLISKKLLKNYLSCLEFFDFPVLILSIDSHSDNNLLIKLINELNSMPESACFKIIITVDHSVDVNDLFTVAWQLLGNSDPFRDHTYLSCGTLIIDATIKAFRTGGFTRRWPNIVCSDSQTISFVDKKWEKMGIGDFIGSPSLEKIRMCYPGDAEIKALS